MATTFWTLIYAGTEKSFQDWGFTDPRLRLVSQAQSTFTVRVPGVANLIAAPPIPYGGSVVIWRNRTFGSGAYSGGTVVFQGRQVTRTGSANSDSPADSLIFGDAWFDLENLVFQQQWNFGTGPATKWFSRLNLFQRYDVSVGVSAAVNGTGVINVTLSSPLVLTTGDYVTLNGLDGINVPVQVTVVDSTHFSVPGHLASAYVSGGTAWPFNKRISNGAQIQQIIDFANASGVSIQSGTIDLNYILPIYPVRAVSCATAVQICLKPQPDAMTWIDYTTTPPTFNCRARASLASVSLPYSDGVKHKSSQLVPRYDLQAPAVVLQYQKTSTSDGETLTDEGTDAYPLGSDGRTVGSLVVPIDLRGANIQNLSVVVKSAALPNLASGDAPSLQWWTHKKKEMENYGGLTMVPSSLTVKDDNHNDLTSTWAALLPNEYQSGEILTWMGISVVQVTVSAMFTYTETDSAGRDSFSMNHQISVRIKLTNSPAGKKLYSALQSIDPGESAPPGLAQQIYNTLAVLQYEGSHVIVDPGLQTTSAIIGPNNRLQLTGGAAAWATMDATIQGASLDFFNSQCELTFGPAKHIAPGDLEELLQFWRFRSIYDNPNLRISGVQSQTQGTEVGGDTAIENTTHGNPLPKLHTIQADGSGGNATRIQHDATIGLIQMRVEDVHGTAVGTESQLYMSLTDLTDGGVARIAKFRKFRFKDADDGCNPKKTYVLCTEVESDP